jgi:formyl-CoA transferase
LKTSNGPLAGIRIVDLTNVLFGPLATRTLGDWGADVIKVEGLAGDLWRYTGQFRNRGMGGQFMAVNRNKRSLAIDLKRAEGKAVLERLIATADALVSNIRPEGLARLGVDYDRCRTLNPRIVFVSATGFGQDGPWKARPAFDEIIQAASGFAASIGSEDQPEFVPSLIADKVCGLELAASVTAALLHRERTGEGQQVEVPMLETLAAFNSIEMLGGFAFEPPIGPAGYNRVRERRPARTRDGWMTMLPYTGDQWQAFFEATGHPEWVEELGVLDPVERSRNIDELYARLRDLTPTRTTAEWATLLLELDIPFADFASLSRISEQEHLNAVGLFQQLDHPTEGTIVQARPPTRFSASPAEIHRFPPHLGEHSREVLAEVGFTKDEIDDLLSSGAVSQAAQTSHRY